MFCLFSSPNEKYGNNYLKQKQQQIWAKHQFIGETIFYRKLLNKILPWQ
jgi:hypothetical protein